ncbi:MAG: nicotinate-nucleotide--dimethylbenzimidazole phosphoribosyltransferase [Desulfobacterales bacterium]|nr:nicotinate-nucleotide--dimethylbenzimidazole phosphoribosyltransferase [Desulfobacterales bacterium]MBF0398410.1 nicotinate-nucleotide--dimethylbenzimidazole phosphoribosyltransferase [Desulfobacterales bacterium]
MNFNVKPVSNELCEKLNHKINQKTKPPGSLGKLENIALKIGNIQNTLTPTLNNPAIIVFASDHGIALEGVSAFPQEVTYQMVYNFLNGGAGINVFARQNNIEVIVVDSGVNYDFKDAKGLINAKIGYSTKNYLHEPAMTIEECLAAIQKGADIVDKVYKKGCNIIGFGEMGIANTSSASIIMNKICDIPIEMCIGRGTGHDDSGLSRKKEILKRAVEKHKIDNDPLKILSTFGGFEIAMCCGAILKACENKMIVIMDGFIITSALLIACKLNINVLDYCIFSHKSNEDGHIKMLNWLKAEPVLNLELRLGEGTGAAICYPIIKSAVTFLNEMASFESAGVANKNQ